jgi:hypothetical protein
MNQGTNPKELPADVLDDVARVVEHMRRSG